MLNFEQTVAEHAMMFLAAHLGIPWKLMIVGMVRFSGWLLTLMFGKDASLMSSGTLRVRNVCTKR